MEHIKFESPDLTAGNVEKIAALFPNCVTEMLDEEHSTADKKVYKKAVNFDMLRQMLSGEVAEGDEAYEFTWVGKKASIVEANRPIRKTLRPCPEESVDWDTTENLYIEGDNLEVLKLLQESYLGKVKLIYIDPPYNTGSDFIYRDNFRVGADEYDEQLGMYDEEENRLFKNTDSNGRFHSDWCSMMYSRLLLARNILSDDGVIFISIDDGEQGNLREICNEIFGNEHFASQIIWQKVYSPRMDVQGFSTSHDYILCYVKNHIESIQQEAFSQNAAQFNFVDPRNQKNYRRRSIRKEGSHSTRSERPKLWFPLIAPDGSEVYPYKPDGTEGCWRWSLEKYKENEKHGVVEWVKTENGWQAYAKQYIDEDATKPFETLWLYQEVGHNHSAAEEVKKIFGAKVFDSPKPKELIMKMLRVATRPSDGEIVLDFFGGSSTTAHAVMQQNSEDGGNRKYIIVQLNEPCEEESEAYKAGYKTLPEIGKERIRRAGAKIKADNPLTTQDLDVGFRVFKVDDTNMEDVYYSPAEYTQQMLTGMESNIKPDRSDLDLLFGCLLDWGLPLSLPYHSETIDGCTVHTYAPGDAELDVRDALIACFDNNVPERVIKEIAGRKPLRAVFRDSSFASSPEKINVEEIFAMLAPDTKVRVI